MAVSYLICAAGLGTRTSVISKTRPKPFMRLHGKSLLRRSIESLPLTQQDRLVVLYSPHMNVDELNLELHSARQICEVQTKLIERPTRGQLETALYGLNEIPETHSVCIFNADTSFTSDGLKPAIDSQVWDGLIPCIQEVGDEWSFCKVIESDHPVLKVVEVAEKKRISDWCSVGLYWFASKELFRRYAEIELNQVLLVKEAYVAPMYNLMIKDGLRIGMSKVEKFRPMGSVEQIEKYWGLSLEQMQKENS